MRLIDADRLYSTIIDEVDPISISLDGGEIRGIMRTIIATEPTVEAVPVIRCKDCECMNKIGGMCYCEHHDFCVQPDFYCADGANLKMEEQNG